MIYLWPLQAETPLSERILVAATGPLVTVLLGGLVVWAVTYKIQQQNADKVLERENARAAEIRKQDLARADAEAERARHGRDDELRHELITKMTETCGGLYLATQHYWRVKRDTDCDGAAIQRARAELDAVYLRVRASGEVIENRLEAYFTTSVPHDLWHAVMDLLTVRYFQLIGQATDGLYEMNAGGRHSTLSVEELRRPQLLLARYQEQSKAAARSVLDTPLRARS